MKITREHKIYSAVGALALLALVIDRAFLGSDITDPDGATAALVEVLGPGEDPIDMDLINDPIPAGDNPLVRHVRGFSHNLDREGAGFARDAFATPASWSGRAVAVVPDTHRVSARQFREDHKLEAVMTTDGVGYALLDGNRLLAVGDTIDGFVVDRVEERSARFRSDEARVTLRIRAGT